MVELYVCEGKWLLLSTKWLGSSEVTLGRGTGRHDWQGSLERLKNTVPKCARCSQIPINDLACQSQLCVFAANTSVGARAVNSKQPALESGVWNLDDWQVRWRVVSL